MVKRIALIILGVVLLGGILVALWWVNERERDADVPKESFIPYNSAVVVNVNSNAKLSPKIEKAFEKEIAAYKSGLAHRVVDTLLKQRLVDSASHSGVSGRGETGCSWSVRVEQERDVCSRRGK